MNPLSTTAAVLGKTSQRSNVPSDSQDIRSGERCKQEADSITCLTAQYRGRGIRAERRGTEDREVDLKKLFHFLFPLTFSIQRNQKAFTGSGDLRAVHHDEFLSECAPVDKLGHHYLLVMLFQFFFSFFSSTYQLKLPAAVVGVLNTRVLPQSRDGGQVLEEDGRLQLPAGHLSRPGVERHQAVPVLLVFRVTPRDVQLLTGVHQDTDTCRESEEEEEEIRSETPTPQSQNQTRTKCK